MNPYNIGESNHRRRLLEQAQAAQQQGGMLGPLGGMLGSTLGSQAGAALGTALIPIPGVGTAIGAGLGGAIGGAAGAGRNPLDITAMDVGMGALGAKIPTEGATAAKEALAAADKAGTVLDAAKQAELAKQAAETTSYMGQATGYLSDKVGGMTDKIVSGLDKMKASMFGPDASDVAALQESVSTVAPLAEKVRQKQMAIVAPALMAEGGEVTPITERLDALEEERKKQQLGPLAMMLLGGGFKGIDLGDYGALGGPLMGLAAAKLLK